MAEKSKAGRVILFLIILVIILLGIIAYSFFIKPTIDGYIIEKQVEAKDIVLSSILQQVQQQGYVQISDLDGNAVVLVPAQQQPQPQQ